MRREYTTTIKNQKASYRSTSYWGWCPNMLALIFVVNAKDVCPGRSKELICAASGKRREMSLCAPPDSTCERPCGVFHLNVRRTGGYVIGKKVFDFVLPAKSIVWGDSSTLANAKMEQQLREAEAKGWVRTMVFRHPVDRIISHYLLNWKPDDPLRLKDWIATYSVTPNRGHDGRTRLWIELDNIYIKILSGWDGGDPPCIGGEIGCHGLPGRPGVNRDSLEKAKKTLGRFTHLLITEWLDHPATVSSMGRALCFYNEKGHVTRKVTPNYSTEKIKTPDFSKDRAPRAPKIASVVDGYREAFYNSTHSEDEIIKNIWRRNRLDLELYAYVTEVAATQLRTDWARFISGTMPDLPSVLCGRYKMLPFCETGKTRRPKKLDAANV